MTLEEWTKPTSKYKVNGNIFTEQLIQMETQSISLSAKRNRKAAKRFLKKALDSKHNQMPRTITVDKNPAYPIAIHELKNYRILPQNVSIRQIKYLNNIVEQDHRSIKRIVRLMLGFQSFDTASKTLKGIEIMHMIRKGQFGALNRYVLGKVNSINKLFGIAV